MPETPFGWLHEDRGRFCDTEWHHVAWQFRYRDQTNFLFVDGRLVRKAQLPAPGGASTRIIAADAERCDIPFQVGGFLRPEHRDGWVPGDFGMTMFNLEGEIDELRISDVMRYPVADRLSIIRQKLPEAEPEPALSGPAGNGCGRRQRLLGAGGGQSARGVEPGAGPRGRFAARRSRRWRSRSSPVRARDEAGATDAHTFSLAVERGRMVTESLPPAFAGAPYRAGLTAEHMARSA